MRAPLDLRAVWGEHVQEVLAERGDEDRMHASDLHSCPMATWQRLHGVKQLPPDDEAFSYYERGHAYEARAYDALVKHLPEQYDVTWGSRDMKNGGIVMLDDIVGHVDFFIEEHVVNGSRLPIAVVDVTTTAKAEGPMWQYGHALKSAAYAVALDAPYFVEWVFQIGFGGVVRDQQDWWFSLDDIADGDPAMVATTWRERVNKAASRLVALRDASHDEMPAALPPIDPLTGERELWRCGRPNSGKSYCRAQCERNARWKPW